MNQKQAAFVNEYLLDLNATQAAIRAGYSKKRADAVGYDLLRNTEIATAIRVAMEDRSKRTVIEQDRVLMEIARLAFNDPRRVFNADGYLLPVQEWPEEVAAAVSSIKVNEIKAADGSVLGETKEIKFWDKVRSLEMAGRHIGLFNDKLSLSGGKGLLNITIITDHDNSKID